MSPLILVLPSAVYSAVLLVGFWRLRRQNPVRQDLNPVTVIVPVRNESGKIGACLEALAGQDFPMEALQVIVVDDHSDDGTPAIVRSRLTRFPDAQLVVLDDPPAAGVTPKKAALLAGLSKAKHPVVALLDGDCVPSASWLRTLAGALHDTVTVASGPVLFDSPGLWGQVMELEFLGLQTAGWLSLAYGRPLTASGANLAFRLRDDVAPSVLLPEVVSGDDVFLVQALARQGEARPVVRREAVVRTGAPQSLGQFVQQRLRWASKLLRYPISELSVLIALYLFNAFLLLLLVETVRGAVSTHALIGAFGLKLAADVPIMVWVADRLGILHRLAWLPLAEVLQSIEILLAPVAFALPFSWKGRRYGPGGRV